MMATPSPARTLPVLAVGIAQSCTTKKRIARRFDYLDMGLRGYTQRGEQKYHLVSKCSHGVEGDRVALDLHGASLRMMTRAAVLYYRVGLTQQAVATRLGISRPTVGRMLAKAQRMGVVTVQINSPVAHVVEAEMALQAAFRLEAVVVVEATDLDDEEASRNDLARGCSEVILSRLKPGLVIGLGWSRTLQYIASHLDDSVLPLDRLDPVTVVQLDGATSPETDQSHPILGLIAVATALDAKQVLLPAPLFTDSEATALGLMRDRSVAEAMALAAQADMCVFGIGDLSNETTLHLSGEINSQQLGELVASGAVGDICGRYFDIEGQPLDNELSRCTMSLPLEVLATRPLRVAAAGGVGRVPAILAALRGGLANALVTDPITAHALLEAASLTTGAARDKHNKVPPR
jgi:deoxyribonucleoside regulator